MNDMLLCCVYYFIRYPKRIAYKGQALAWTLDLEGFLF